MINIFNLVKTYFEHTIKQIAAENNLSLQEEDFERINVEPSKENGHGDLACNVAMVLAKQFSNIPILNNPQKLAKEIVTKTNFDGIRKLEIAGPGFINIFLKTEFFYNVIDNLLQENNFAFPNLGKGISVNLEYASPNPTGPIHVGHTRGAIYGDVLANLLSKVGFEVLKEYYINDAGVQIGTLIKSSYLRYLQACGQEISIPDGLYPGEYLIEVGRKIKENFGDALIKESQEVIYHKIRDFVVDNMLDLIKSDLALLGIIHDSYFSEKKNLHDTNKIEEVINLLKEKNLAYVGKLEAPKTQKGVGALPEGYSDQDQLLFRSSQFGDDQDRVLQKADGSYTYFAADAAYVISKFERKAKIFIMPLGFDHSGYVKRLTAMVAALTNKEAQLKIILCQMVKFIKNGEPLKMSKRAGNFITAKEVMDEVGADVLRFIMLTRKNDAPFDFDLAKVIDQSKDNPIFYVQYAHARCCSVLRNSKEEFPDLVKNLETSGSTKIKLLSLLTDESELSLIKKISNFPRVIEMSAVNFEPHRIAFYLQELAAQFHSLWHKGSEDNKLKFIIKENLELTKARILLILATMKIIAAALDIFNIKPIEEMR